MDGVTIRAAETRDGGAIGALHVASWRETYAGILPDALLAGLSVEARGAMWGGAIADPEAFGGGAVFVAEESGRMLGFGACGGQRDAGLARCGFGGEIGALYVLRAHQGRGIGRGIMAALAGALTERGHKGASLWVLRENAPARRFYEELGGAEVGERIERQGDAALVEIAYGWRDVGLLLGDSRRRPLAPAREGR